MTTALAPDAETTWKLRLGGGSVRRRCEGESRADCGSDRGRKDCDDRMNASVDHTNVVDAQKTTPDPGLGADLLAVVVRLHRLASQRIRKPLTAGKARLLATIEAHGEARIGDLAAVDHCSQSTITTQVRGLESIGLVGRTADPGDARSVRIRITAEGTRAHNAVKGDGAAAIEPQLALLDAEDRLRASPSRSSVRRRAGRAGIDNEALSNTGKDEEAPILAARRGRVFCAQKSALSCP